MSGSDENRKAYPGMPMNVSTEGLDEGGEETTRRIAYQPSFEPVTTDFDSPSLAPSSQFTSTLNTAPAKAVAASAIPTERKGVWQLRDVKPLPEFYQVERTAVFVRNATPAEITSRISNVLRVRSIGAIYVDEEAKAKCTTDEGVEFRVKLHRGRGKFSNGIIVEVQRRFGTSPTFSDHTQAILDAAEGKTPSSPPNVNLPTVEADDTDEYKPNGANSLAPVSKMFSFKGQDLRYLAFQTLLSLTDSSKMGPLTARAVAEELLRLEADNEVGAEVITLVLDKRTDDEMYKMRAMAMIVLANAAEAVNGDFPQKLWDKLLPVLVNDLMQAERNPRVALQAARVIEYALADGSRVGGAEEALQIALKAGDERHAGLHRQAQRCLTKCA